MGSSPRAGAAAPWEVLASCSVLLPVWTCRCQKCRVNLSLCRFLAILSWAARRREGRLSRYSSSWRPSPVQRRRCPHRGPTATLEHKVNQRPSHSRWD